MLIQQEYAKRHALPMALSTHTLKNGMIFLRASGSNRLGRNITHIMMEVRWIPHERHPGSYQIIFQSPLHDSHGNRTNFALVQEPQALSYEEFEDCIRQIRKNSLSNFKAITDARLIALFVWEMFVCCYDGWIVRNGTAKLLSRIEASFDPMLSIETRLQHCEAATAMIGVANSAVYEKWQMNFAAHRRRNLPWLGKLFNGD